MRVLLVEDEKKTASFVRKALQAESFAVDVMANGEDALFAAAHTPFDVIVLDIMLPGRDGLSVLRQLRERKNTTPVLLLSARGEVNERVEGFDVTSLIASLKCEKMGPKAAIPAQNDLLKNGGQMPTNDSIGAVLSNVVPTLKMAEGVVSEPFLPAGDQGRKDRFAPSTGQFVPNAHRLSFAQ